MLRSTVSPIMNRFANSSTVSLWNSNIRQAVDLGHAGKAISLFRQMKQNGIQPSKMTFPLLSKSCGKLAILSLSQMLHSHVIKSPFESVMRVQTGLVDMYVKCGDLGFAHALFEEMPQRDITSWNAMIAGFAQLLLVEKVATLIQQMRLAGVSPDYFTVMELTQMSSSVGDVKLLSAVHCLGTRIGVDHDISIANTWVAAYSKCSDLGMAEMVFNGIDMDLRTVVSWNSMLSRYAYLAEPLKAIGLYKHMLSNGFRPAASTIPLLVKSCGKLAILSLSQMLHSHVIKSPFESDMCVQTGLVNMYVKCGELGFAHALFKGMPQRDITSWNVMINGFAQLLLVEKVAILIQQMRADGVLPDHVTVMGLTQMCSGVGDLKLLSAVHCLGTRIGVEHDVLVANTWVAAYSKCGDFGMAEMVFNGIDMDLRTVVSWNSMLTGCAYLAEPLKAIGLYKHMLSDGFRPDASTILSLLSSCTGKEALCVGKLIHCCGIKVGCDSDITVPNTVISMYSKCGDTDSARHMFNCMVDRTSVSWTAIIGAYAEKGDLDEALTLFYSMEAAGEKPDLVTMIYIISGCGQRGAPGVGKWIHNYTISIGLRDNVMVCNALIDMYAKCGSMNHSWELFHSMKGKTIVSWATMLTGCALNGEFKEALDLFSAMLESGLKPNHITFLAVLQACTHAGSLEKGWEFFDLMTEVYKINPGLDHYSCMVHLLCRKGMLKEALVFIQQMGIKADAAVWAVLLGACKNYLNVDIAEHAAYHIMQLEPLVSAPYVEMVNIYALAGRWDGVAAIRTKMKGNQVKKSPGQSLVQVNGKGRAFTAEDRSQPADSVIYELLDSLALQMRGRRKVLD